MAADDGDGVHDVRMVRRRIAELDRDIYARGEFIRFARAGVDGGKPEDREQTIANYMAEIEDAEAEAEQLRYLIALYEKSQQDELRRTRATWPVAWQVAVSFFAVIVLLFFAFAVLRL